MKYDFLIVGAGLFGAVFAERAKKPGSTVWLLKKEPMQAEISILKRLQE